MKLAVAVCLFAGLPCDARVLEHVAVAALKDLRQQPDAKLYEYSGFIVLRGGAYQYTMFPHTDRQPDRVQYDIVAHMLPGDVLMGIYHNHPCHATTHYVGMFSIPDLIAAKARGVPAFLLNNCNGDVLEFDWSVDRVRATGRDVKVRTIDGEKMYHLPTGRAIGNIGITSENLDERL